MKPGNSVITPEKAKQILFGLDPENSCRESFTMFRIMTVTGLYILETTRFVDKKDITRRAHSNP